MIWNPVSLAYFPGSCGGGGQMVRGKSAGRARGDERYGMTASRDGTEEATFAQNLKSRIKKKHVPAIGRRIATTNKGDGYRLRGYVEL